MKKKPSKLFPVLLAVLVVLAGYVAFPSLGGVLGGILPHARPASPPVAPRVPAANLQPAKPADRPVVATGPAPGAAKPPIAAIGPAAGPNKPPTAGTAPAAGIATPMTSATESAPSAVQPATGGGKPAGAAPTAAPRPAGEPEAPLTSLVGTAQAGRTDPFSPLVTPPVVRAPTTATLPPTPGVGLPMPPGFTAPGATTPGTGQDPAAGMTVTGIVGGSSRVAIVKTEAGKTFIVGPGERIENAQVVRIMEDKVVLKRDNVTFELVLGGERSS